MAITILNWIIWKLAPNSLCVCLHKEEIAVHSVEKNHLDKRRQNMSPEMSWVMSLALRKPRADSSILVSLQTPSQFFCFILDTPGLPILHTCVWATESLPASSTACLGSADNSRILWSQYWILTKDIDHCWLSRVNPITYTFQLVPKEIYNIPNKHGSFQDSVIPLKVPL